MFGKPTFLHCVFLMFGGHSCFTCYFKHIELLISWFPAWLSLSVLSLIQYPLKPAMLLPMVGKKSRLSWIHFLPQKILSSISRLKTRSEVPFGSPKPSWMSRLHQWSSGSRLTLLHGAHLEGKSSHIRRCYSLDPNPPRLKTSRMVS